MVEQIKGEAGGRGKQMTRGGCRRRNRWTGRPYGRRRIKDKWDEGGLGKKSISRY